MSEKSMKKHYGRLLKEFMLLCGKLVDRGQPYMAIVLNHELYRFLYPVEPFIMFQHTNPMGFIVDHIKKLTSLGYAVIECMNPYPFKAFEDMNPMDIGLLEEKTSALYSSLWKDFDKDAYLTESLRLLRRRITVKTINACIRGRTVLDIGCGSGRYSIALARVGAMKVVGVDYDKESFHEGRRLVKKLKLPVKFRAANVLALPFKDNSFDFIFCNGVLHHTHSIQRGLKEMHRVLKPNGCAFLYLYAAGGAFWETRTAMRKLFKRIPIEYTERVLKMIGMPPNRFIFCDTWYVPVETLTRKADLERMLAAVDFRFEKIVSRNAFDLDAALKKGIRGAAEMWGDGEHRYILFKSSEKAQYRESLWPK